MSLEMIFARRSIRRFTTDGVTDAQIQKILEAAMAAPSANNQKPWHFVVTRNRTILDDLADAHPYGKMLTQATCAIAVCGVPQISNAYWIQDCSAATQNILLAATALNLGSVWLGCTPRNDRVAAIQKILTIPEEFPVLSLIAIGHPGEQKPPRTQFDPNRVHWDHW